MSLTYSLKILKILYPFMWESLDYLGLLCLSRVFSNKKYKISITSVNNNNTNKNTKRSAERIYSFIGKWISYFISSNSYHLTLVSFYKWEICNQRDKEALPVQSVWISLEHCGWHWLGLSRYPHWTLRCAEVPLKALNGKNEVEILLSFFSASWAIWLSVRE